jgi:transposase
MAVAHSLRVVIYHVLRNRQAYTELGIDYLDRLDATRIERHHVRRLEQLGYTVTLSPIAGSNTPEHEFRGNTSDRSG